VLWTHNVIEWVFDMSKRKAQQDWRATLFYWRGTLSLDSQDKLVWQGAWVGSEDTAPTAEQYHESTNTFKLTSSVSSIGGLSLEALSTTEVSFAGDYLLDQGDSSGPGTYRDISHHVAFSKLYSAGFAAVGAVGETEFGRFVSHGRLTISEGEGEGEGEGKEPKLTLTLARRYVVDKDARAALTSASAALAQSLGPDAEPSLVLDAFTALPLRLVKAKAKAAKAKGKA